MEKQNQLSIFFDSHCPLCRMEMKALAERIDNDALVFVDINNADEMKAYPQFRWQDLNSRLHAVDNHGVLYTGLEASYQAWKIAGRGWMYAPLVWPGIKHITEPLYRFFARYRYSISYALTGKKRGPEYPVCSDDRCR